MAKGVEKLKKIYKIISPILIIVFCFSGCMSSNNLNDLTVVQALGVDNIDNQTMVTIQYLDINKSGVATDALNGNITASTSGVSSNISDALSQAAKGLSQKIFMGQNKIIIFGSEYSEIGIDKGLDYLIRSIDSRPDVLVAMSNTTAKDIVENSENGSRIPAENIYKLLKLGEQNGQGAVVSVNDVLNLYQDKTTDVYLPILQSNDDGVSCDGIVCYADERIATRLDQYQTNGFLFIKNRISGGTLAIDNPEFGYIGIEVVKACSKPSAKVVDDKIIFTCKIDVDILLNELEKGSTSDLKPSKIQDIELLVKNRIDDMAISAFNTCISSVSDPFGIGKYLARDDIKSYNSLKNDWHNNLNKVEIVMDTNVKLKNINDNDFKK